MTTAASLRHAFARRGFSLTELAIVLGIIGLLLGAIWVAAAAVYQNNLSKKAAADALTIAANWKSVYGAKRIDITDAGVLTGTALTGTDITKMTIQNKFMPPDMILTGVTANGVGPWNGSIVNVYSSQADNGIVVKFSGMTNDQCNRFGDIITGSNDQIIYENINGNKRLLPPLGTDAYFTVANISAYCTAGATANYVYVMYGM